MKNKLTIELELSANKVEELETLMNELNITAMKDLLNNALTLLEWTVDQKKDGRIIIALDEKTDSYRELVWCNE